MAGKNVVARSVEDSITDDAGTGYETGVRGRLQDEIEDGALAVLNEHAFGNGHQGRPQDRQLTVEIRPSRQIVALDQLFDAHIPDADPIGEPARIGNLAHSIHVLSPQQRTLRFVSKAVDHHVPSGTQLNEGRLVDAEIVGIALDRIVGQELLGRGTSPCNQQGHYQQKAPSKSAHGLS